MSDTQVRIASPRDEDEIMNLVLSFHKEEGLAPLDKDIASGVIREVLNGIGVVGVIGQPGKIEASVSLLPGRLWYSAAPTLESLWNFTLPKYRKSGNAKALVTFAKRQAEKLNIPLLLDVVTTDENSPKIKLYERALGTRAGAVFNYRPDTDAPNESDARMRTADLRDEAEIIEICRELHRENGSFDTDESLAIPVIQENLAGNGVIGVIGERGKIEGTIFLQTARMWYSREPLIEEFFAYVRPQYRNSHNAKSLISFAKRQADRLRVPLRMCIVSRLATEQKIKLYQRLLGQPKGAFFLFRPEGTA